MSGRVAPPGLAALLALAFLYCVVPYCVVPPGSVSAQDVELAARARGLRVPQGYYDRLAEDSLAFTLPNGLFAVGPEGRAAVRVAEGTKRMLLIPVLFSDSPEPWVSSQEIERSIFTGPAPGGTISEAYREMSRGKLVLSGDVTPWVRTSLTRAQVVGTSSGLGWDARTGEFLVEALRLADPSVDFRLYDNDGSDNVPDSGDDDGRVDALAFEFIEIAASCGGNAIWPHQSGISAWTGGQPHLTDDLDLEGLPIKVNAYIIQSAVECAGINVQGAGTIAHEFGHMLGLPDYYHPTAGEGQAPGSGRRWVLGCWDLMAAGSWGCGPYDPVRLSFGPTHFSARSKYEVGWLQYVDVGEVRDQEFVIEPVQVSGSALRIPLDTTGTEFLIMEYRSRTGFDDELPAEGVMIYHQDQSGSLRPEVGTNESYFLSVVEQDVNNSLQRNSFEGGSRGEPGDAWPVGGQARKLTYETTPSSRHNDGTASNVTVHSLVVEQGRARVRLSRAETPAVIVPATPLSVSQVVTFEQRFRIAGGYMPYDAIGTVPAGTTLRAQGDELVLSGSVVEPGPFALALRVRDAHGSMSAELFVPMTAGEWLVGEDRLLQLFLRSGVEPLTAGERAYLDATGNGNSRYDVGDLRAWLRSQGAIP